MAAGNGRGGDITRELDELSSALMGDALDMLAEGHDVNVLLVVEDARGVVAPYEFSDDGPEQLLEGARKKVVDLASQKGDASLGLGRPVRYAIAYEGAVEDEDGSYRDALLLEFGEKGRASYSAFSFYEGKGSGECFAWSEPAAAGEETPLL